MTEREEELVIKLDSGRDLDLDPQRPLVRT